MVGDILLFLTGAGLVLLGAILAKALTPMDRRPVSDELGRMLEYSHQQMSANYSFLLDNMDALSEAHAACLKFALKALTVAKARDVQESSSALGSLAQIDVEAEAQLEERLAAIKQAVENHVPIGGQLNSSQTPLKPNLPRGSIHTSDNDILTPL